MGRRTVVRFVSVLIAASSNPAFAIVVISQVYGGGGNAGAPFKNDFVELFNADTVAVSLSGWTIQYASTTGSTWASTLLSGSINPGQYLLIQESSGGSDGGALPTPDLSGTLTMSNMAGKVALVSSSVLLTGTCPLNPAIVDFVGYGGSTNCFEGAGATGNLSNATAAARSTPCVDGDDNGADFAVVAPTPRNTASPGTTCSAIGYAAVQFPNVLEASACPSPASTQVYGQVYVAGATDASASPAPGMRAQLGFGPDGSDPTLQWTWVDAIVNPGFDFALNNNDEYLASLQPHASGPFDYAYRWSYHKQAFVYSDVFPGTSNGYSIADNGQLTVSGETIYCDRFDQ
jgi:hypothetical protein